MKFSIQIILSDAARARAARAIAKQTGEPVSADFVGPEFVTDCPPIYYPDFVSVRVADGEYTYNSRTVERVRVKEIK